MKKNDVFQFTAPNGAKVDAVVLKEIQFNQCGENCFEMLYLCYAQNRLFTVSNKILCFEFAGAHLEGELKVGPALVDYAILPDYDELLARYNDIEVAQAETAAGM